MFPLSWQRCLNRLARTVEAGRRPTRRPGSSLPWRPAVEGLEDRTVPTVTNLNTGHSFGTIQAAIDDPATVAGNTILADAGTYAEKVTINKSIILEGAQHGVDARTRSGAESIVTGAGNSGFTPFNVTASNVTIDGFTVEDATSGNTFGFGIVLSTGTSGTHVLNNIIQDNIVGLSLANNSASNQTVIQHNLFKNNNQSGPSSGTGIYSDQFNAGGTLSDVLIDGNTFTGQTDAGIDFSSTDATKPATGITISNNVFDGNGRGLIAFNLTSSTIRGNTFKNSTGSATADIRLFEGDTGLTITGNLLQNGAGRALRVSNSGTGSPDASNIRFVLNSISGYTGPSGTVQVDNYTGTLDATCNWWGAISGPSTAANPGGLGQTLVDPGSHVKFMPWLVYGTDASPTTPGFQLPSSIAVSAGGDVSAADNDYRRLANAVACLQSGQTLTLSGTFDWTQPFAAAAWARGVDGVAGNGDDYVIAVPANINNVTLTAASLGSATVQGPGDLANVDFEGVLAFIDPTGTNPGRGGPNTGWTISNLQIYDFDNAVQYDTITQGRFSNTTITNNHIRVARDLNDVVAPNDPSQNIGIYFGFGTNQTISNNVIDIPGDGVRGSGSGGFSGTYGIQCATSGGDVYDGLQITGNTINVLNAQSADPERVVGIWENSDGTSSNITVSDNTFRDLAAGNNAALNDQIAFRLTSPSSATTTVKYQNNHVIGAHVGFQYYPTYDNTGTQPVQLIGNTLTGVFNGFDFANGAKTVNYLSGNSATGTGAGTGVGVGVGSTVTLDAAFGGNTITHFGTGLDVAGALTAATMNAFTNNTGDGILIRASAGPVGLIMCNTISGNGNAGLENQAAAQVNAEKNFWGDASGPTNPGNPGGSGDRVIGNVDFTPWAISADCTLLSSSNAAGVTLMPDPCVEGQQALVVFGTARADTIRINPVSGSNRIEVQITSQGVMFDRTYDPSTFDRIIVYGLGGNDDIQVDRQVLTPVMLFGGDGDDRLVAGGGQAVLVGGRGRDTLVGGSARGILIGGVGQDFLFGGSAGDIEIAGTTDYDSNLMALCTLIQGWAAPTTYNARIAALSGGAYPLSPATVHDDAAGNYLQGGPGQDWFFANLDGVGNNNVKDQIHGGQAGEVVTHITL